MCIHELRDSSLTWHSALHIEDEELRKSALHTSGIIQDARTPAPLRETLSFPSAQEEGALGKRLEALFEALKDPERRRALRSKLDGLDDQVRWEGLKIAVDDLQKMMHSIPTLLS